MEKSRLAVEAERVTRAAQDRALQEARMAEAEAPAVAVTYCPICYEPIDDETPHCRAEFVFD